MIIYNNSNGDTCHSYMMKCPYCECEFGANYDEYKYLKRNNYKNPVPKPEDFDETNEVSDYGDFKCPECGREFIHSLNPRHIISPLNMTSKPYSKITKFVIMVIFILNAILGVLLLITKNSIFNTLSLIVTSVGIVYTVICLLSYSVFSYGKHGYDISIKKK